MREKSSLKGKLCCTVIAFGALLILGGCASMLARNEKLMGVPAAQKSIVPLSSHKENHPQQTDSQYTPADYGLKGGTWDILESGEKVYTLADGNSAKNVWVEDGGKYYYVDYTGCLMKNNYSPDGFWVGEDGSWISSIEQRKDDVEPLSGQPYGEGTVMTIDVINYSDNANYAKATLTYSFGSKEEFNVIPLGNSTYLLEFKYESYSGYLMSVSGDKKTLIVSGLGCTDTYTIQSGDISKMATASAVPNITGADKDVVIEDFDWFFNDGFPGDGTTYKELWGLGGMWKCMLYTRSNADGKESRRIVIADTDVQYMGYKLTLLLHTKARYEHPENEREAMEHIDDTQVTMTMEGDWDEERTSMDVYSVNSELNCRINTFVTKNGFDYALGSVYNGDNEIGQVVMIRKTP